MRSLNLYPCCHISLSYIMGSDINIIQQRIQTTCSHASRCHNCHYCSPFHISLLIMDIVIMLEGNGKQDHSKNHMILQFVTLKHAHYMYVYHFIQMKFHLKVHPTIEITPSN